MNIFFFLDFTSDSCCDDKIIDRLILTPFPLKRFSHYSNTSNRITPTTTTETTKTVTNNQIHEVYYAATDILTVSINE